MIDPYEENLPCKDPFCATYGKPHPHCRCYNQNSPFYEAPVMKNGNKTYSKTPFSESKHKRSGGGTFAKKDVTEKDKVSYHHKFASKDHPRKPDGSFKNDWKSQGPKELSNSVKLGQSKYGSKE